MYSTQENTGYVRSLQIIFFALLLGQLTVFAVLWFVIEPPAEPGIYQSPLDFAFIGIAVALQIGSFVAVQKIIESARGRADFDVKLSTYRVAQLARFALLEGSVLICLVGYFFLTANQILLALAAAGIAIFITKMPFRDKIVNDLDMTVEEAEMLDKA